MEKTCSFGGCGRIHESRGLCKSHAQQARAGRQLVAIPAAAASKGEFFWARVDKTESCWLWTGKKTTLGYGQVKFRGVVVQAHRYSWEMANGAIPDAGVIDHLCHVPGCVNPDHLRIASHKQNMENRSGAHKNSKSGVRGVHWEESSRSWRAGIGHNGVTIHLGRFASVADAENAVTAKRKEIFSVSN